MPDREIRSDWSGELLITPAANYLAELTLTKGDESFTLELPGCLALVLISLQQAWDADEGRRESRRGFRSAEQLAKTKAKMEGNRFAIKYKAIATYVMRIRHWIASAWAHTGFKGNPPNLIETKSPMGYRLNTYLQLVWDDPAVEMGGA